MKLWKCNKVNVINGKNKLNNNNKIKKYITNIYFFAFFLENVIK